MVGIREVGALFGALALYGCAVGPPTGPTVMALPGQGKSIADFQQDDLTCRQYASQQTAGASPNAATNESLAGGAPAGALLGAAPGAAIGAATGGAATGAAIGAESGLLVGGAAGSEAANLSSAGLQRRHDISYMQCMAAKGESVPSASGLASAYPYDYGYRYYAYPRYQYWRYGYPYPGYQHWRYDFPYYNGPGFSGGLFFGFGGHYHHRHHHHGGGSRHHH
jgi:hypothetical protein